MRLAPASWQTEAWWCSMNGHVAPAATATGFPPEQQLSTPLADGTQLARCLRCDAWVHTPTPTSTDRPEHLPEPLRGRALDELVVIRAIAIERGLHVVLFLMLAGVLIALQIGLPAVQEQARQVLTVLEQTRTAHPRLATYLSDLIRMDGGHLWVLVGIAMAYAALETVEAVFLWQGKRWAEYLTVVATAALLPLEIYELTEKVSALRVMALIVNLLILFYLVWTKRLFGVRGGQRGLEAELAADTDWAQLHNRAPISPTG